jgi:hypothetical protein
MMMKLTTKTRIDIRQPELLMTANKKMMICSSASLAASIYVKA